MLIVSYFFMSTFWQQIEKISVQYIDILFYSFEQPLAFEPIRKPKTGWGLKAVSRSADRFLVYYSNTEASS